MIVNVMESGNISNEVGISIESLTTGKYFDFLKKYALKLSFGDTMFADDIIQHVLIQASEHSPTTGIFRWLKVTAYNYFATTMRNERSLVRKTTNLQVETTLSPDKNDAPIPPEESGFPRGDDVSFVELDDRLANALYSPGARVSPDKASLFAFVYLFDATYQEAAERFRVPIGTVMSRLHHTREALSTSPQVIELAREYGISTNNTRMRGQRCAWGRKQDDGQVDSL